MIPVELLLSALRNLLSAFGTGVLPGQGTTSFPTESNAVLRSVRDDTHLDSRHVLTQWQGVAADAAAAAIDTALLATQVIADHGDDMVGIIESAAASVRRGAAEINRLVESFSTVARALGPALTTPAGLAAIIPIAADHLQHGLQITTRVHGELEQDAGRLGTLLHQTTVPRPATAHIGQIPEAISGDRDVTLPDGSVVQAPTPRAATAVRSALSQQGVPYLWGGTTPDEGFDCSGLTQWAYRQAGVELPRLAQDQDTAGHQVSQAELAPGDLAVWSGHVAMYIGNGKLIEAGDPVEISALRTDNSGQAFEGFFRPA